MADPGRPSSSIEGHPARGATIRLAAARDLYAAHALLPWLARSVVPADAVFVAEADDGICAAAAFSSLVHGVRHPGFAGEVVVHERHRRQGIGRALVRALTDAARDWAVPYLRARDATDDPGALAFLAGLGAVPTGQRLCFESSADLSAFAKRFPRWHDTATGIDGATTNITRPLRHDDLDAVAAAYGAAVNEPLPFALQRLRATLADPATAALSIVLEREAQVTGFILARRDADGVPALDFWYSHPSNPRGAPAIALLSAAARNAFEHGVERFRFQCRDDARTTLRMAREIQATPIRTETFHAIAV